MNLHNILFFWTGTRQNSEHLRGHNGLENIIRVAAQCADHPRRACTGRIYVILAVFATGKKAGEIGPDPPLRNLARSAQGRIDGECVHSSDAGKTNWTIFGEFLALHSRSPGVYGMLSHDGWCRLPSSCGYAGPTGIWTLYVRSSQQDTGNCQHQVEFCVKAGQISNRVAVTR